MLRSRSHSCNPECGSASIQVLVVLLAMLPLAIASISRFESLVSQQSYLAERQEAQEVRNLLVSTLTDSNTCGCLLKDGFDPSQPQNFITSVPSACNEANEPVHPLVIAGETAFGSLTGLKVKTISLSNFTQLNANTYTGVIRVSFESGQGTMALRDIEIPETFFTDPLSAGGKKLILSCERERSSRILATYSETKLNASEIQTQTQIDSQGYLLLSAGMIKGKYKTLSVSVDGTERIISTSDQNGDSYNSHAVSLKLALTAGTHDIHLKVLDSQSGTMDLFVVPQLKLDYVVLAL